MVNNRPLTAVSSDDKDPLPLTPNHLLTLKLQPVSPVPGKFAEADLYARKRWKQVQYLAGAFWQRWKNEYLATLQTRSKWHGPKQDLEEDDVVMVRDDLVPRPEWKIVRVKTVHHGRDNRVRRVTLRTTVGKTMERAVTALVLLSPAKGW